MPDERAQALIQELEGRYGYAVSKRPSTPEEWRAEAVRLLDLLEAGLRQGGQPDERLPPVVKANLERLARGELDVEAALVACVVSLSRVQNDLLRPQGG